MFVKDFMIKEAITVHKDSSLKDILETLSKNRIGGVPVVDSENHLVGMISDGDLLRFLNPKRFFAYSFVYSETLEENIGEVENVRAKDIMTKKVHYLKEDSHIDNALKELSTFKFKKMPVINNEKEVIGVVSRGDLIRKLSEIVLETSK